MRLRSGHLKAAPEGGCRVSGFGLPGGTPQPPTRSLGLLADSPFWQGW